MIVSPNRRHNKQVFYKYTSARTAKSLLINKTLRFSSPLLFNDPFDVSRRLKFGFDIDDFNKAFLEELIRLLESQDDITTINPKIRALLNYCHKLPADQRDSFVNQLRKYPPLMQLDELESFQRMEHQWQELIPMSRILSVSTEKDNPVMWWSYAENYSGVVIELECLDIYDSPLLAAKEVIYTNDFPNIGTLAYWLKKITGQIDFDYRKIFERLELTKTRHWSYENEWRVISFEKNSGQLYTDYEIHPRTFCKVFLGENISDQDKEDICKLIDFDLTHLEVFEMELSHERRQIEFRKYK